MLAFFSALGLNKILLIIFGIVVVVSVLKKLFKLAITIAIIAALIHFGLPLIQTAMSKM